MVQFSIGDFHLLQKNVDYDSVFRQKDTEKGTLLPSICRDPNVTVELIRDFCRCAHCLSPTLFTLVNSFLTQQGHVGVFAVTSMFEVQYRVPLLFTYRQFRLSGENEALFICLETLLTSSGAKLTLEIQIRQFCAVFPQCENACM